MTSGMTRGAVVRPCSAPVPKTETRDTMPAIVPRITAPVADMAATLMDSHAADSTWLSPNSRRTT